MRSQLANNLQGAFDDPVHYIQNKMKQMFFQMLADWLLQTEAFKSTFGKLMEGLHLGGTTAHSTGVGQALGQVSADAPRQDRHLHRQAGRSQHRRTGTRRPHPPRRRPHRRTHPNSGSPPCCDDHIQSAFQVR